MRPGEKNRPVPSWPTLAEAKRETWLRELLDDAQHAARLSGWEMDFVGDLSGRLALHGAALRLSPRQIETLERIERKVHGS